MRCFVDCLPDGSFRHFRIAKQHPDFEGQLVQKLAVECESHADRKALPQGSCGDIGERRHMRVRVAFQAAAELPQGQKLRIGNRTRRFEHRIQQGAGMTFAENQMVIVRVFRAAPIVMQVLAEQDRHQIRR